MARILSPAAQGEREMLRQLIACDPTGLTTLAVPIRSGQGILQFGTFIVLDGTRALLPAHAAGVLSMTVDTDSEFFQDDEAVAIYTRGRFSWLAITRANPGTVFDELTIAGLKARDRLRSDVQRCTPEMDQSALLGGQRFQDVYGPALVHAGSHSRAHARFRLASSAPAPEEKKR